MTGWHRVGRRGGPANWWGERFELRRIDRRWFVLDHELPLAVSGEPRRRGLVSTGWPTMAAAKVWLVDELIETGQWPGPL